VRPVNFACGTDKTYTSEIAPQLDAVQEAVGSASLESISKGNLSPKVPLRPRDTFTLWRVRILGLEGR
jgi:hypothetical protein